MGEHLAKRVSANNSTNTASTPRFEHVNLTTDSVAASDRFEWWRNEFGVLHKVEVAPSKRQSFMAKGEHWLLGSILIGRYQTPARRVVRTSADVRRSEVDHWVLRIATKGVFESRGSYGEFRAFPGQLTIGTFAQSYTDDYSAGEWITAIIPRHALPALGVAPFVVTPGPLSGSNAGLLGDFLLSLVQRIPQANPSELSSIADTTQAMIAACLVGGAASDTAMPVERSVLIRERVDRIIRDNLASARLNAERICELAGVSRSTLYRLFEDRGGVAAYIQAMRLKRVYEQLSNPHFVHDTIGSLAAGQGMYNVAAFNRAFRRHFGCTPGDVRAAFLHADFVPAGFGAAARSFADLLR